MQKPTPKFIRFQVDRKIPIGNIYLTTKSYLLTKTLKNLARMDVIAIINCDDQEILFKDSEITQLSPKRSRECYNTIALEVQGACKLIEETIFQLKKSVMIFGSSKENPFYFSNIYLCSFFIYYRYNLNDLNNVSDKYCRINIQEKIIEVSSQPHLNQAPFLLNQMNDFNISEHNGYTFYLDPYSIGELEKFVKTKFQCNQQVQQKTDIWLNKKTTEKLEFEKYLDQLSSQVFNLENITKALQSIKLNEDPLEKYCKNPQPIIEENIYNTNIELSFIKTKKK